MLLEPANELMMIYYPRFHLLADDFIILTRRIFFVCRRGNDIQYVFFATEFLRSNQYLVSTSNDLPSTTSRNKARLAAYYVCTTFFYVALVS